MLGKIACTNLFHAFPVAPFLVTVLGDDHLEWQLSFLGEDRIKQTRDAWLHVERPTTRQMGSRLHNPDTANQVLNR